MQPPVAGVLKAVITALLIVGGLYLALLAYLFLVQRSLLYLPSREAPDLVLAGVADVMRPVRLTSADGVQTVSWYRAPASVEAPVLVYLHGNAGHIGHRADKVLPFVKAGLGVVLVGYRGYGGNPGTPSEQGLYADARAALDFLEREDVSAGRVVLYGESLGSGVAVQMASERGAGAVVLEAPGTSIAAVAQKHYPYVPARWLVRDRYDSLAKIERVNAPLLVLHGERDRIIPAAFGRRLFEAAREPKELQVFPEANHVDLQDHGAAGVVLDFIGRHVTHKASARDS